MSDAIHFAKNNFAESFTQMRQQNPLGPMRQATRNLAAKAQEDEPNAGIYRHGIPAHLRQSATVGLRRGAKIGSYVGGFVEWAVGANPKKTAQGSDVPQERAGRLKTSTTLAENFMGIAGTLGGGLLGATLKTIEHLVVSGAYVSGIFLRRCGGLRHQHPRAGVVPDLRVGIARQATGPEEATNGREQQGSRRPQGSRRLDARGPCHRSERRLKNPSAQPLGLEHCPDGP